MRKATSQWHRLVLLLDLSGRLLLAMIPEILETAYVLTSPNAVTPITTATNYGVS